MAFRNMPQLCAAGFPQQLAQVQAPRAFSRASQLLPWAFCTSTGPRRRRHGVRVPIDVNHSDWDCALEGAPQRTATPDHPGVRPAAPTYHVRLGRAADRRAASDAAKRLPQAARRRRSAGLRQHRDRPPARQAGATDLQALAPPTLAALSGHRRQQMWDAAAQHRALRCCATPSQQSAAGAAPGARGTKSSSTTPPPA